MGVLNPGRAGATLVVTRMTLVARMGMRCFAGAGRDKPVAYAPMSSIPDADGRFPGPGSGP